MDSEINDEDRAALDSIFRDFAAQAIPLLRPQFALDGSPETLCHYTDFAGLHGILQSGKIWATYTQTMNDATEQTYGEGILRTYISQLSDAEAARKLLSMMDVFSRSTYAACFCERSDVLNMWLTYANRGGGYCLEFKASPDGILGGAYPGFPNSFNLRINYGNEITPAIKASLDYAIDHARRSTHHAVVSLSWMTLLALRFKHPAFELEREWRMVFQNPDVSQLRFRAGPTEIRPYLEFLPMSQHEQQTLPLKRIIFGPTLRKDSVMVETIGLMLSKFGYGGVAVEACGIPYRL